MGDMPEEVMEKAIKDPEKLYKNPAAVLHDQRLTQAQKNKVLQSWEQDQLALLRAEEENMPQKNHTSSPVDLLQKVKEAEKVLKNTKEDGQSA